MPLRELGGTSSVKAPISALPGEAICPLDIPTYDGDPSVVHCDVDLIQGGFGPQGYRYWMAYTPYPGAQREQPSICASHDGVHWVLPAGCPNPVTPNSEIIAAGYLYGSDPDLVFLPDGVTLAMYYRLYDDGTGNKQGIYRKTSTDGATWSAGTRVLNVTGGFDTALSPTIVWDGTQFWMWTVNHPAATMNQRLEYRNSADGITWSAASSCTIPLNLDPWHLDVRVAAGKFHALISTLDNALGGASRLTYLTSTDGITWTGRSATYSSNDRAVPVSGYAFDAGSRHYRSAFVPVQGGAGDSPIAWDIYVSGLPANYRTNNGPNSIPVGVDTGNPWRFGLYKGMTLPRPIKATQPALIVPPGAVLKDYAMTAWFTASDALASRFSLDQETPLRYINSAVGISSGNIELAIIRLRGTGHLSFDRLKWSGRIACPASGAFRYDMGLETYEAGDYGVMLWCDNTTATFPYGTSSGGGWMAAAKITASFTGSTGIPAAGGSLGGWTNRSIAITLEGDV